MHKLLEKGETQEMRLKRRKKQGIIKRAGQAGLVGKGGGGEKVCENEEKQARGKRSAKIARDRHTTAKEQDGREKRKEKAELRMHIVIQS
jgi:hypothetical protein